MKLMNKFKTVPVALASCLVVSMATYSGVTAGERFSTEVESQSARSKTALFNEVGTNKPESVKATGANAVNSVNSITDAGQSAASAVNITAQQNKIQSDAKIAELEKKLANAAAPALTTRTETKTVNFYRTGRCTSYANNGRCRSQQYNTYTKAATFLVSEQGGTVVARSLTNCGTRTVQSNLRISQVPATHRQAETVIAPSC